MSAPSRIVISNFPTGLERRFIPEKIDNSAFPVIENAYTWRDRVRKKRGTQLLGRLRRSITSVTLTNQANGASYSVADLLADAAINQRATQADASIAIGSLSIVVGSYTFTDLPQDSNLIQTTGPAGYITGITGISKAANAVVTLSAPHNFIATEQVYITGVAGMIEINNAIYTIQSVTATTITLNVDSTSFSTYTGGGNSYRVSGSINYETTALSLSFVPALGGLTNVVVTFDYYPTIPVMGLEDFDGDPSIEVNFPTHVAFDTRYAYEFDQPTNNYYVDASFYKLTANPVVWSGQTYEQFFSTNYFNAMFVTNGKPGFHFKAITNMIRTGQADVDPPSPVPAGKTRLEIVGHNLTAGDIIFVNEVEAGGAGISSAINLLTLEVDSVITVNKVDVLLDSTAFANYTTGGIAQYLTRSVSNTEDGIRWYDGRGVNLGFVNFAPPLQSGLSPEYLVGAKTIIVFKDRLLFGGVYTQTSSGAAVFQSNRIVFCQNAFNGSPFYAGSSSISIVPSGVSNTFFDAQSWMDNVIGKGGYIEPNINQSLISMNYSMDMVLLGLESRWQKLVYTQNESDPFTILNVDTEFGNESTFSTIEIDDGVVASGDFGYVQVNPSGSQRIDLKIPDIIYSIRQSDNGNQRVTAIRDYENEFIYFSYPVSPEVCCCVYPSRTLLYNYSEKSFAIFKESYTHHGYFRRSSAFTWATIPYRSWSKWTSPWSSSKLSPRFPNLISGNQKGYVLIRDIGTVDDVSLPIKSITNATANLEIPNHCLEGGDFVRIKNILGGQTNLNDNIYKIAFVDNDNIQLIDAPTLTGTYLGSGELQRMTKFDVQTKHFPNMWGNARRMRLGNIRTLLNTTEDGEFTLEVYPSQRSISTNDQSYIPVTQTILTRPEASRPWLQEQNQIWHLNATAMTGDSIGIGFTLSDDQMKNFNIVSADWELHSIVMDIYESGILA